MEENNKENSTNNEESSMFSANSSDESMFSLSDDSMFNSDESSLFEPDNNVDKNNQSDKNIDSIEEVENDNQDSGFFNETQENIESGNVDSDVVVENSNNIDESLFQENISDDFNNQETDYTNTDYNSTSFGSEDDVDDSLITVRPVKFQQFREPVSNLSIKKNLDIMQDIPMHITVELGRTKSSIKEIVNMSIGSVVELDKIAGEQVEIFVNDKLVARGEVIVIEDKFGVRVVNTNIPKQII